MVGWFLVAGFVLLAAGSELAIRGGAGLARALGLEPLWIGLLVVAGATALPELFVSLRAATAGAPDIALGGIVGGAIFNLLFVLGLGALLRPMGSSPKVVARDGGALLAASLGVIVMAGDGVLTRQDGLVLLAGFIGFLALTTFTDWRRSPEHSVALGRAIARTQGEKLPALAALFLLLLGAILLGLGAHFAVSGSTALAHELNLRESFIGLTLVAAGVSLPKLIATLIAAARGRTDLVVGAMLGANVFDLLGVLGVTALVAPLTVSSPLASADVYVLAAASAALLPLLAMRWRLTRPRGLVLLCAYGCYLAFLAWRQGLISMTMFGPG